LRLINLGKYQKDALWGQDVITRSFLNFESQHVVKIQPRFPMCFRGPLCILISSPRAYGTNRKFYLLAIELRFVQRTASLKVLLVIQLSGIFGPGSKKKKEQKFLRDKKSMNLKPAKIFCIFMSLEKETRYFLSRYFNSD